MQDKMLLLQNWSPSCRPACKEAFLDCDFFWNVATNRETKSPSLASCTDGGVECLPPKTLCNLAEDHASLARESVPEAGLSIFYAERRVLGPAVPSDNRTPAWLFRSIWRSQDLQHRLRLRSRSTEATTPSSEQGTRSESDFGRGMQHKPALLLLPRAAGESVQPQT